LPWEYQAGSKTFEFDRAIYADDSVKRALRDSLHGKCCFCESKVTHISPGDVEHFRPKAACRQSQDDPLLRPGYYWLAYSWTNLLFCCEQCNRRHKRNHFPLIDPNTRARSHRARVREEQPLFINPAEIDPERFLGFREEYLYAKGANPQASATIDALRLNREELAEERRGLLTKLKLLIDFRSTIVALPSDLQSPENEILLSEIDAILETSVQDFSPYAAMARSLVAASGLKIKY